MNKIEILTKEIKKVMELASTRYGVDFQDTAIRFDLNRKAFGMAGFKNGAFYVNFNMKACETEEGFNHILRNTIPHEIAHIVCFKKPHLGQNHDRGWKAVCSAIGGNGKRASGPQVDLGKTRNMTEYVYTATCGKVMTISANRHARIQKGASYRLRSSGGFVNNTCKFVRA